MTDPIVQDEFHEELDLAAILRELYRRKWLILGVTLLAGLLGAGYSLTLHNTYEGSAGLIIREPENPIAGEAQPLSVETLRILSESTDVKWTLFEKLWEGRTLERWKDQSQDKRGQFLSFQNSLSTEVQQQESKGAGGAVGLLPILLLKAFAGSPEEAQQVANAWVDVVTERSSTIYTKGVEELGVFLGGVYERADTNLVEQELELSQKELAADVDLKQARYEKIRSKVIDIESEVIDLEMTQQTAVFLMEEIQKRLAEREFEGQWLGDAAQDLILGGRRDRLDIANPSPTAVRVLQQVDAVLKLDAELMELVTTTNLDSKKSESESLQGLLDTANTDIAEKRLALLKQNLGLEDLRRRLAEQEVEGVWIGELLDAHYRTALNGAAPEGEAAAPPAVTEQTRRLDDTIRDIVGREFALRAYVRESDFEFKRVQLGLLEEELKQALGARDTAVASLTVAQTRLAYLQPELDRQPEKISLDKSITDDALWGAFLQGAPGAGGGGAVATPLKTEVLNPAHDRVQQMVVDGTAETVSLTEQIKFLDERVPRLRSDIEALRTETAEIQMEMENRSAGIASQQSSLEVLAAAYHNDKTQLETALLEQRRSEEELKILEAGRDDVHAQYREKELEISQITQRIAAKTNYLGTMRKGLDILASDYQKEREELEELRLQEVRNEAMKSLKTTLLEEKTQESEALQETLASTRHELELATRDVAKVKGVRETLATRAEEIALLQVSAQNASRSGTTVLFHAGANPLKVSPARSRIVLLSMLGACVLSCAASIAGLAVRTVNAPPRSPGLA